EARTDAAGNYRFDGVPVGTVYLLADTGDAAAPAQHAVDVVTSTLAGLNVRLRGRTSGSVVAFDTLQADIRLMGAGGIRATVVRNDGVTPVPGAEVRVHTSFAFDIEGGTRTANADGVADVYPVVEGGFSLLAKDPVSGVVGRVLGTMPSAPPDHFALDLTVRLGAVADEDAGTVVETPRTGT